MFGDVILAPSRNPWRSVSTLTVSVAIHGLLLAAALTIHFRDSIAPALNRYRSVPLNLRLQDLKPYVPKPVKALLPVASADMKPRIKAAREFRATPAPIAPRSVVEAPSLAIPDAPKVPLSTLELPKVAVASPPLKTDNLNPVLSVPVQTVARPIVQTNGFSATETTKNDRRTVAMQIGAFGAAATSSDPQRAGRNIGASGFGAAQAGVSNAPAARTIAKAQFGDLEQQTAPRASHPSINWGAFGDSSVGSADRLQSAKSATPDATPVEILSKPRPAYTEEARRLQIEGEVTLELEFQASGQVRLVRLINGLGHGLDESAVAAVQQIRFKPAMRAGAPVDSFALVRIAFQLAY